jgi:hypothetical protein
MPSSTASGDVRTLSGPLREWPCVCLIGRLLGHLCVGICPQLTFAGVDCRATAWASPALESHDLYGAGRADCPGCLSSHVVARQPSRRARRQPGLSLLAAPHGICRTPPLPSAAHQCGQGRRDNMAGCPTGKFRYRDAIAARMALATVRHQDKSYRPKLERSAYRCPSCAGWHLTARR